MILDSYNDPKGATIPNCFQAGTNDLLPVADGSIASCRPNKITHAKVIVTVDYSKLDTTITAKIKFATFLRLDVKSQVVKNGTNVNRTLMTFLGNKNILAIDDVKFKKEVFDHAESISDPYDLDEANFTGNTATINIDKKKKRFLIRSIKRPMTLLLTRYLNLSA